MHHTNQSAREELLEIFLKLKKNYLDLLLNELKNCSQEALQELVAGLLNKKNNPLYAEIRKPGSRIYIKVNCRQTRRTGLSQLHSFTDSWQDPNPTVAALITACGYTEQTRTEADTLHIHLLDLLQLVEPLLPPSNPFPKQHPGKARKNITFHT
jgi:hypothetical protein